MTNELSERISTNYQHVLDQVAQSAISSGRAPEDVKIVVVSKGHPVDVVQNALQAGIRCFGENYLQEAIEKMGVIENNEQIEWHMIGHVQSRKARLVSEKFDWMHTLDSLKLAGRLDRFASEIGRKIPVLLEVNISGEESKFGWPAWQEGEWGLLRDTWRELLLFDNIDVRGLMTMPPFMPDAEMTRPYFKRLVRLQSYLKEHIPEIDWSELSMGMSADYEVAVQEGATIVRIGTAILGVREVK